MEAELDLHIVVQPNLILLQGALMSMIEGWLIEASDPSDMVSRSKRDLTSPNNDAEYFERKRFPRLPILILEYFNFLPVLLDNKLIVSSLIDEAVVVHAFKGWPSRTAGREAVGSVKPEERIELLRSEIGVTRSALKEDPPRSLDSQDFVGFMSDLRLSVSRASKLVGGVG